MANYNLIQRTPHYDLYLKCPEYMPRRFGRSGLNSGFTKQINQTTNTSASAEPKVEHVESVDKLTSEQKDALIEKLHSGQGGLSKEDWDSFLLDLVDLGLIDNKERLHASGALLTLPDTDQNGAWHSTVSTSSVRNFFDVWNGDPLEWLEKADLYLMKKCKLAELAGNGCGSLFQQRKDCAKVFEILKSLLC